jgi:hypothetical protein
MIRVIAKSILASAALLAAAGVSAQPSAGAYVATPVNAPAKSVLMTRDTAWNVRDGAFVTVNAPMREMAACQLVARSAGQLSGFVANGKAFDTAQLDACNAKAKGIKTIVAKTDATAVPAN